MRWFGHVQRRNSEYIDRRMMKLEAPGRRSRGRPKRRFMDAVKEDMSLVGVREEDAEDSQMEADDLLWQPLKGKAERKRRRLLNDLDFDNCIKRKWAYFLEINDTPEIAPSLLWEIGKAVLRGQIISYSHKKKKEQQEERSLEKKVKELEIINANNPIPKI